ncbi:MAG: serine hydrolase [Candidatus Taylorbacteria bacterium]|nr:serine hydrolase [Candidatus Taylorbacteria bacterium]
MNIPDLQKLARDTRSTRETGIALMAASGILAVLLFLPITPEQDYPVPAAVATYTAPDAFANVPIEAEAAIVYDLFTGETLYAKNTDAQLPLASLTKLLTVYASLSTLSPDTPITIPESVSSVEGPRTFSVGQTFSLSDLARLTLTASLNDGAAALASAAAERESRSENEMLASAATALNLSQTHKHTPSTGAVLT